MLQILYTALDLFQIACEFFALALHGLKFVAEYAEKSLSCPAADATQWWK